MTNNKQQTEINAVEYLDKVNQFAKENNTDKPRQQTAVEWLLNAIQTKNGEEFSSYYTEFIEQAKEMEKEQMSIKLPSDEEIRKVINPFQNQMDDFDLGFIHGVQWLRDKIQGGEQ